MITYLLSQLPPWVYIVIIALVVGALFFFFRPIFDMIWGILPTWAKQLIGAAGALGIAYLAGGYVRGKKEKELRARNNAHAEEARNKIDAQVQTIPHSKLDDELRRTGSLRD